MAPMATPLLPQALHSMGDFCVKFSSIREISDQPNASTFNYATTHQTAKLVYAVAMRQHQIVNGSTDLGDRQYSSTSAQYNTADNTGCAYNVTIKYIEFTETP